MSGMSGAIRRHPYLRNSARAVALLALVVFSASATLDLRSASEVSEANAVRDASASRGASTAWVQDTYAKLPLSFEVNVGQTDSQVDYLARGSGYTLFITHADAVLALRGVGRSPARTSESLADAQATGVRAATVSVMRMRVVGGTAPRAAPQQQLPGAVNYFIGNDPTKWRVGVPTFARIIYPDVYPGIDLAYYGNQGSLEYDFVVRPGADASAIALRYEGALDVELDPQGNLVLRLGGEEVRQPRPFVYQVVGDERREVQGSYVRQEAGTIGFSVAVYDRTRPLVIDPTLVYSTYLGGSGGDAGVGVAVDSAGNAYVTGVTGSADFPTTAGDFDTTLGGNGDAFVTKLNAAGSALLYSTYLGGSGDDVGLGMAVDSAGNAYVTGATVLGNFSTTAGAFDTTSNGGTDAFVTKLNPAGSALLYSTYLGGSLTDQGFGIAVDSAGNAYVTGFLDSANFPTTAGAFDTTINSGDAEDAFVTKLNPAGSALLYSTYLGGSGSDGGLGMAVDSAGNAYVTGFTGSANFPTTAGAFDTTSNGGFDDAFVTKLNPAGSAPLVYSSYLGGSGDDQGRGIVVDSGLNAYVTGSTTSADFPTTAGAFDTTSNGGFDAFVTKLNAAGSAPLAYSTYLGGSVTDVGNGIAVDSAGNAYVTGASVSTNFPTTAGAFDTTSNGGFDAFVTKLNSAGSAPLVYSTYLGGSVTDQGSGIAVDSAGNAYVTGFTESTNFPTTAGAFDTTSNGGPDAFVTKITPPIGPPPPATLTLEPTAAINAVGEQHCVTATVEDASGNPTPGITVRFAVDGAQATFSTPANGSGTTDANGEATFCFSAELPGDNPIHAFADTDNDTMQDPGEPTGAANKTWTVPPSAALCEVKITQGGQITALNLDRANFGGVAKSDGGNLSGSENYQDHGPAQPLHMKSTQITAVTCSPDRMTAQIFGDATIDDSGSFTFRIRVTDNGEQGNTDTYGIILSNGYASGDQMLEGGNVQIR